MGVGASGASVGSCLATPARRPLTRRSGEQEKVLDLAGCVRDEHQPRNRHNRQHPRQRGHATPGLPRSQRGHHGEGVRGRSCHLDGLHGHWLGIAGPPTRAAVMQQFARWHLRRLERPGVSDLYSWTEMNARVEMGEHRAADEARVANLIMQARHRAADGPAGRGYQSGDDGSGEGSEALHGCKASTHRDPRSLSGIVQVTRSVRRGSQTYRVALRRRRRARASWVGAAHRAFALRH